jgi:transcription initiation factor TFIID subunit TAF12
MICKPRELVEAQKAAGNPSRTYEVIEKSGWFSLFIRNQVEMTPRMHVCMLPKIHSTASRRQQGRAYKENASGSSSAQGSRTDWQGKFRIPAAVHANLASNKSR